jgi:hypothetical protein
VKIELGRARIKGKELQEDLRIYIEFSNEVF